MPRIACGLLSFAALSGLICTAIGAPMGSPAVVQGKVTDATGASIAGARIALTGPSERLATTDMSGWFRVEAPAEGAHSITISNSSFQPFSRSLDLKSGNVLQIDVVLQPETMRQTVIVSESAAAVEAITRLGGSLHETPRSIEVLGSDEIRDRNFRSVPDLLYFVPNMGVNSYRAGGYHFYARGFRMGPDDTRVDGFAGLNVGGGFGGSLFGVEEAVLLRGPASLTYGASASPGGMINLITKKPQEARTTRLDLRSGTYAGRGVGLTQRPSVSADLDSTGALTPGGRILYRGLATIENQNYFTGGVLDRNRYLNGSLTFRLDPYGRYSITPIVQYARFNRPAGGGIVISPSTSLSANDGITGPIQTLDLSPLDVNSSWGGRIDRTSQAGFDFRAYPTSRWQANLAYRTLQMDTYVDQATPQATSATQISLLRDAGEVQRLLARSDTRRRYHNVDANTSYELRGASWKSQFSLGTYSRVVATQATTPAGTVPAAHSPINIYTGIVRSPLMFGGYPALVFGPQDTTTTWNGYVQNRTSVLNDKLVVTLGLGYGQNHPGGRPVQRGDVMPNAAILYNITGDLAVYGSYSTSFNPVDATLEDILGVRGAFDPSLGRSYEAGVKYDLPGRRVSTTLSFFRNSISNALVQTGLNDVNANGNRYYVQSGTRRGQGAELSGDFRIRSEWFVSGAVSFLDSIYTGEGPASAAATLPIPGSRAEKSPRWAWNARTHYQRSEGKFAGFGGSLSLMWQGQRLGSNGARTFAAPDPLMLPSFTRTDASVSYRFNDSIDVACNVENLLDQLIFVNASVGSAMEIAAPRTATLRLSYRF
ncbi:MAG TPA: TonB-dependent receptor [Bryobacteraceae bacterium]|nr:TonB-dependent receptor [Bryobacteraceae bacterium]